jgi:hypothetical protein
MVEKEKTMRHIEDKKKRKRTESQEANPSQAMPEEDQTKGKKAKRNFKQIQSIETLVKDKSRVSQSLVKSVFTKRSPVAG